MYSLCAFSPKGSLTLSKRILIVVNAAPGAEQELKLHHLLKSVDSESFNTCRKIRYSTSLDIKWDRLESRRF